LSTLQIVFHVSQDLVTSNGQKLTTFWNRVQQHYNKNQPPTCVKRPTKNLETKWGAIKYNVSKFVGCHGSIIALNESKTFEKGT
jgi:hypothetical protein